MANTDKRFIQVGTYLLNIDQIIYIRTIPTGLRIVTTGQHKEGGQYGILVPKPQAEKVLDALRELVAITIDVTTED